jgi:hypothetical protein
VRVRVRAMMVSHRNVTVSGGQAAAGECVRTGLTRCRQRGASGCLDREMARVQTRGGDFLSGGDQRLGWLGWVCRWGG